MSTEDKWIWVFNLACMAIMIGVGVFLVLFK